MGSEFHWMGLPPPPFVRWPEPAAWYLLGRHAVVDLLRNLPKGSRCLWVPDYFCHDIADYWRGFFQLATYVDNPVWSEPDWSTLRPASNDVVLAVNYFGVRGGDPWQHWRENNACVLLEDHSHDPVSGWARNSKADYAFSSLRKTMPVPDGAILWSPRGLPLPLTPAGDGSGSALKLAAMIWKYEYLEGRATAAAKSVYRKWQLFGEDAFQQSTVVSSVTPYSREYLAPGVPLKWRRQRAANVRRLIRQLRTWSAAKPLFHSWPSDSVPLGTVICLSSPEERDLVRKRLEDSNIYCPVHWPASTDTNPVVRKLAATILTIPADQRYRDRDIDKVVCILKN
jgi:hypothetical protein